MHKPQEPIWLLTRDEEDAAADALQLERAGVRCARVPCIECVPQAWPQWPQREGTPVFFLTSRRAAAMLPFEACGQPLIAAVAPATASWLQKHGHSVDVVSFGGAESLARTLLAEWNIRRRPLWHMRYPTSDVGFHTERQAEAIACLEGIGAVDRAVVYKIRAAVNLRQHLALYVHHPYNLTFFSPSAVHAFLDAYPRGARIPERVVCYGASTKYTWGMSRPTDWPGAELAGMSVVDAILH